MCKFESSEKDESGSKQADPSQAGHEAKTCFIKVTALVPSKRTFSFHRHISALVFFHVLVCSLLLPRRLKSTALRVSEKALYNILNLYILSTTSNPN